MTLTLEVTGPQADKLGTKSRKVFQDAGGTIGRLPTNDLVLGDAYVSNLHARIHFRNGVFSIEDRSKNGVFINSPDPDARLKYGEPYVLQSGDWIFIEPYEIKASISGAPAQEAPSPLSDLFSAQPAGRSSPSKDPFGLDDGFGFPSASVPPASVSPSSRPPLDLSDGSAPEDVDPLKVLGLQGERAPERRPAADELLHRPAWRDHFEPPAVSSSRPAAPAPGDALIPEGYDPFKDSALFGSPAAPEPPAPALPRDRSSTPQPAEGSSASPARRPVEPAPSYPPEMQSPSSERSAPAGPKSRAPYVSSQTPAANALSPGKLERDRPGLPVRCDEHVTLADVLVAAGIDGVDVTPELARDFGRILRVVVEGVMDVLKSRQQIKDEFRLPHTTFQRAGNNPLKFSVDVDDALHNLLVKRNAKFLGPAEAFDDAFIDIRHHQMAMLEGVRVAFDAMLAEFDCDRLQEAFDRTARKSALVAMPAKLRYWELYREKIRAMAADADRTFRSLFGDEFARAYEEQLKRLKAAESSDKS